MVSDKQSNYDILESELQWFRQIASYRIGHPKSKAYFQDLVPATIPELSGLTHYEQVIGRLKLGATDRIVLLLALARALNDESFFALQDLLAEPPPGQPVVLKPDQALYTKRMLGGYLHRETQAFIPTLKTLLFLIAGSDKFAQQEALLHFQEQHPLFLEGIVEMHPLGGEQEEKHIVQDWINYQIFLNPAYLRYFLGGSAPQPKADLKLPVRLLESGLTLEHLVLSEKVQEQLQPALHFVKHGQEFFQREGIRNKFKEGFVMLLHGPPEVDKTLTATALGNSLGIQTYQLEVAQVLAKYVGESSQNMEKALAELERAIQWLEGQMCILFIDRADAIIGDQTKTKASKKADTPVDVSFLLQRLEKFPGLLILATDYERNLNEVPGYHIQTCLHIPLPNEAQRVQLWKNILPSPFAYASPNLPQILARQFALNSGHIQHILKQACLHAVSDGVEVLEFNCHLEPYIKVACVKKNQTYYTPHNILTLLQLKEDEYIQYKYWTDALPSKMSFVPERLPEYLAKSLQLNKNQITNIVKKSLPVQETSQKGNLRFEHLITALKAVCIEQANLDWATIEAHMQQLMSKVNVLKESVETKRDEIEQRGAKNEILKHETSKNEKQKEEKSSEDTALPQKPENPQPIVNQSSKLSPTPSYPSQSSVQPTATNTGPSSEKYVPPPAEPQYIMDGSRVVLNIEPAANCWLRFLPQGFTYSRQEMPKNLGKFYALTEKEIMIILQLAANSAESEGANCIDFTPHISNNLEELKRRLGKTSLYRDKFASM